MGAILRFLRGTPEEWAVKGDHVLLAGEPAVEEHEGYVLMKVGDGTTPWSDLEYTINSALAYQQLTVGFDEATQTLKYYPQGAPTGQSLVFAVIDGFITLMKNGAPIELLTQANLDLYLGSVTAQVITSVETTTFTIQVNHMGNADTLRPAAAAHVTWVGYVAPNNAVIGDLIIGFDITAPDYPSGLVTIPSSGQVVLTWNPPAAVDVATYRVYRNGVLAAQNLANETWTDTGRTNGQSYTYRVSAVDFAGNESIQSDAATTLVYAAKPVIDDPSILGWWQADAATYFTDGSTVTLADSSRKQRHAKRLGGAAAPSFVASGMGSAALPCVRKDADAQWFDPVIGAGPADTSYMFFALVYMAAATGKVGHLFGGMAVADAIQVNVLYPHLAAVFHATGSTGTSSLGVGVGTATYGTPFLLTVSYDKPNNVIYVRKNKSDIASISVPAGQIWTSASLMFFGYNGSGTGGAWGDFATLAGYGTYDTTLRDQVEASLGARIGI